MDFDDAYLEALALRMKVFLVGTSFESAYGGPAVSVSRLAAHLAAGGVDVVLWAPDGSATTSPLINDKPRLDRRSGPLKRVLAETIGSVDIIHDNGVWRRHNHELAHTARQLRLPRVVTLRGMLEPWALAYRALKKKLAWTLYQRRDLNSAAVLHATAETEAENAERLGLKPPIVVVPNGVDLPDIRQEVEIHRPSSRSRRRALFLGRLHPKKGIPMLLDAWARLRPQDWELIIAGPAEKGHNVEIAKQAEQLGIASDVTISGPVYGVEKNTLYHSAELFILPTYSENFGMSVAEALAHEVPVLTTTGAPWGLVESERCGWWVPPTIEGVLQGLVAATATDQIELRAMGQRGRDLMQEKFAWDRIAQAVHDEIYSPLVN